MSEEALLIEQFLRGDQQAFDRLVLAHQETVRRFVYQATRNETDTDDLSQEVFIKVYRQLHKFRGDSSFSTWLYRIASNVVTDHFRRKRLREWVPLDQILEPVAEENIRNGQDRRNWLLGRLHLLSPLEHRVVILHALQELPMATVANILDTSESSAKVSYHNAKKKLRRWVDDR